MFHASRFTTMLGPLQPQTIHILAFGKLLFFGVLGGGVWVHAQLNKSKQWLLPALAVVIAILALQYAILRGAAVPWNQRSGDELFVTANYQRVISDGFGHDFSYFQLPPFYPPLFFYVIGRAAAWLHLSGIGAAKLGVLVATAWAPLAVFIFARAIRKSDDEIAASPYFFHFLTLLPFVVVDPAALFAKPYEFISAFGTLLWFLVVARIASHENRLTWLSVIVIGGIGAILFATYYLWFVLVAIAVLIASPWRSRKSLQRYWTRWLSIAAVVVSASVWYWGPLMFSYVRFGLENWQPAFFIPSDLNFFPPLEFTLRSFWLWFGLFCLLRFRRRPMVRPGLLLLVATYVWQMASMVATIGGDAPFQASRGFSFLGEIILGYGAAYGIAGWFIPAASHGFSHIKQILLERMSPVAGSSLGQSTKFFSAWLILCLALPFGLWLDREGTKQRIDDIRTLDRGTAPFVEYFQQHPNDARLVTLSFFPKLNAEVALHQYINHNQHTSHPAANFSRRLAYLDGLASARSPEQFYQRFIKGNPYEPIEQLILYPYRGNYELYFWVDDFPNGGRELVVRWPQTLIAEPYFQRVPTLSVAGFDAWRPR